MHKHNRVLMHHSYPLDVFFIRYSGKNTVVCIIRIESTYLGSKIYSSKTGNQTCFLRLSSKPT